MGGIRDMVGRAMRRAERQSSNSERPRGRRISQRAIDQATGGATRRARNARRQGR